MDDRTGVLEMTYDKRLMKAHELLKVAAEAQEALWAATSDLEIELEAVYGTRVELKAEEFQRELPLQEMLDARGLELAEEVVGFKCGVCRGEVEVDGACWECGDVRG